MDYQGSFLELAGPGSRIDTIGQNGNEGLHYKCSGCFTLCEECDTMSQEDVSPLAKQYQYDEITKAQHYQLLPDKGIQVIDVMRAVLSKEEFKGFCKGNIMKYALRAGEKFGEPSDKDLRKARQYIDYCLEEE